MNYKWLILFGCLLFTACNSPQPTAPSDVSSEKKSDATANALSDPSESAATDTAHAEFEAIKSRYDAELKEFLAMLQSSDQSRLEELAADQHPDPSQYAEEMLVLSEKHDNRELELDCLMWIVDNMRLGKTAEKAYDRLFQKFPQEKSLKEICMSLSFLEPSSIVESRLKRLMEESPFDSVKAEATYALTGYLNRLQRIKLRYDRQPADQLSEASLRYVDERVVEIKELESLYDTLISDYAKLKPFEGSRTNYKDLATNGLFELNNLRIGMIAPEIEGDDLDGVSFKLSDYRGKVVVLDFWGDW